MNEYNTGRSALVARLAYVFFSSYSTEAPFGSQHFFKPYDPVVVRLLDVGDMMDDLQVMRTVN